MVQRNQSTIVLHSRATVSRAGDSRGLLFAALMAGVVIVASAAGAQGWQMPKQDAPPPDSQQTQPRDRFTLPPTAPDRDDSPIDRLMSDMFRRLQPHLEGIGDELASTMNEFAPAFDELGRMMDDIGNYERPERLPNGDIIIRRRADAPPPPPMDELQRFLPRKRDPDAPPAEPRPTVPQPTPGVPQTDL